MQDLRSDLCGDFALIPGSTSNVVNRILKTIDIPDVHKQAHTNLGHEHLWHRRGLAQQRKEPVWQKR